MIRHLICAAALLGLAASCSTYEARPVDLRRDSDAWLNLSQQLCDKNRRLSAADLRRIGLLLNPDLNRARLNYAKSTRVSEMAGLWEDPSLSADLVRVLRENITNGGISPGLTLPVTGLPHISKRIAEQYKEADYWNVKTDERDFLAKLDALRYRIIITHEKLDIMNQRLSQLEDEQKRIGHLHEIGEVEFADYQVVNQRLFDTIKEKQELENEHLQQHRQLIALLGLHPNVGEVELSGGLPPEVPTAVVVPDGERLLRSPEIRALSATYAAGEEELRREIRRQYPELGLGGSYEREDNNNKIGVGLELSLPIWNRNREAIAAAEGERDIRACDLISRWRSILQNASSLGEQQKLVRSHCISEHERLTRLRRNGERQEELYKLGETGLPALAEARHEIYQRRLSYLDCLAQLLDIQVQLYYLNPDFNA